MFNFQINGYAGFTCIKSCSVGITKQYSHEAVYTANENEYSTNRLGRIPINVELIKLNRRLGGVERVLVQSEDGRFDPQLLPCRGVLERDT